MPDIIAEIFYIFFKYFIYLLKKIYISFEKILYIF